MRKVLITAGLIAAMAAGLQSSATASPARVPAPAGQIMNDRVIQHIIPPAVVAAAAPASAMQSTYIVRPGDVLSAISARFCGRAGAFPALAAASGIRNPDLIYPGQRIVLTCSGAPAVVTTAARTTTKAPPKPAAAPVAANGSSAARVVAFALAQVGKPYVWGAAGPNGYDCSGLVMASYRSIGINLPHFTGDLIHHGASVSRSELRAGDLVFLSAGHVGLVIGDGRMVAAPQPGERVKVQSIYAFYAGRRIL